MHAAELGIRLSLSPDSICLEHDLLIPSEEMITAVGNLLENAVEELADPANAHRAIKEIKLSLFCRRDFNMIVCEDTRAWYLQGAGGAYLRQRYFHKGRQQRPRSVPDKGNCRPPRRRTYH